MVLLSWLRKSKAGSDFADEVADAGSSEALHGLSFLRLWRGCGRPLKACESPLSGPFHLRLMLKKLQQDGGFNFRAVPSASGVPHSSAVPHMEGKRPSRLRPECPTFVERLILRR